MQSYENYLYFCKNMLPHKSDSTLSQFVGLLFQRAPMLRVALALALGILLAECLPAVPLWLLCLVAVGGVGLMATATYLFQHKWLFAFSLWLTFAVAGWMLVELHAPQDPFAGRPSLRDTTLWVHLTETPRPAARSYQVVAEVDSVGGAATQGRLMLFVAKDSLSATLAVGDRLRLTATPRLPNAEENPYQFNYRRYLRHHGILWQCYVPHDAWQRMADSAAVLGLRQRMLQLQQYWVRQIGSFDLTPRQRGIAEALLLGWREEVDETTQRQFREAGITHLLCVSGLHVGVLALLVGGSLFFLGRRRWQRIVKGVVQLVAVWFFVLLTGMAPATLRAGVMFSLMIVGDMGGLRSNTLNNLATSAVLIFCFAPMQLFDVGFQLSYAAVLGILAWQRPLRDLLPGLVEHRSKPHRWLLGRVWDWTCLSTAAQLGTLPLVLYYFHQFPLYFLIANLTVVPLAGVLLATALLTVLTGGGAWITALLRWELGCVESLTGWVSSLPSALLEGLYCDGPMVLLLILALLLFTCWLRGKIRWALPAVVGCLLIVALHMVGVNHRAAQQQEVVVYRAGKYLAVECVQGRHGYLVCDTLVAREPALIDYQRSGFMLRRRIQSTTVLPIDTSYSGGTCVVRHRCILFGSQKILVIDKSNAGPFYTNHPTTQKPAPIPLHLDAVVVAPRTYIDTARLREVLTYDTLYDRSARF